MGNGVDVPQMEWEVEPPLTGPAGPPGEVTKAELNAKVAPLASKEELANGLGPKASKEELNEGLAPKASKVEVEEVTAKVTEKLYALEHLNLEKVEKKEDVSAELQALIETAIARESAVILPNTAIYLSGTTAILNAPVWSMEGSGPKSKIVDMNTTGPCLKYTHNDGANGRFFWKNFTIELGVTKPAFESVLFSKLQTAGFELDNIVITTPLVKSFKSFTAIKMVDTYEGVFTNVNWRTWFGHTLVYEDPTLNGGNIQFDSCRSYHASNGMLINGHITSNNFEFNNCKWVAGGTGTEFYKQLTTGIPAVGATEITLPTGVGVNYIQPNAAVILVSAKGMEVVYTAVEAPYNSGTGVMKLRTAVALNHAEFADLRIITCSFWSVISGFLTPLMSFNNSHMEQSPAFFGSNPGLHTEDHMWSVSQESFSGETHGAFLWSNQDSNCKFVNSMHLHSTTTASAIICPIAPEPSANQGLPTFEIDGVVTEVPNKASMENSEYRPYWSPDNIFKEPSTTPEGIKVRTAAKGVERDRTLGDNSWQTFKQGLIANYTAIASDSILFVNSTSGEITVTLPTIINKVIIVKKTDASGNAVKIVGAGGGAIDGAASQKLTAQYQFLRILCIGTTFQTI